VEVVLVVVALVAGALLAVQAGVNALVRAHVPRPEWAALLNFGVGFVALGAWLLVVRAPLPPLAPLSRMPPWAWGGGILGALYVTGIVLLAPRLGVGATVALTVAGQMAAALALDHLGALGLAARPISGAKVLGAALLIAGVALMRR
jgi:bacterial/archaeal transporter family-2 protein